MATAYSTFVLITDLATMHEVFHDSARRQAPDAEIRIGFINILHCRKPIMRDFTAYSFYVLKTLCFQKWSNFPSSQVATAKSTKKGHLAFEQLQSSVRTMHSGSFQYHWLLQGRIQNVIWIYLLSFSTIRILLTDSSDLFSKIGW